jgi:thiosulfate dehydrogenase [quinone] large subunit
MRELSSFQRFGLVALRTLIGWHFLYEGYYKLMLPGWSREGQRVGEWSAAGYLQNATGPFAPFFQEMSRSAAIGWIDIAIPIALALVGLSLILGLFTQLGCWGGVALLTMFYLAAIPTKGMPGPGMEGAYLIVSKTLIECAALVVLASFRTGAIAGLDLLFERRRAVLAEPALADGPPR